LGLKFPPEIVFSEIARVIKSEVGVTFFNRKF